ncbi:MAG: tRNA lysidine(34) synthetase TilS [Planctomycetota bacterium]|jgi:tRNA(Ile)-lysidine synthase|nr:tRNA lysidine(34) synthetase TilS [Planctomycetota bacterium]
MVKMLSPLPAAPLAVGFSGGVDSTVLLTLLAERQPVVAAHLNHGLRGADADADENFCREFCAARKIRFAAKKVDLTTPRAARPEKNLEAAARLARWRFFAEICAAHNLAGVALAHHRDDQAETLVLRLRRGAGWRGLQGMRERTVVNIDGRRLEIFRPLLRRATRAEIVAYARAKNLPWREDATNRDERLARNRARRVLLPAIATDFPDYRERLEKLAAVAQAQTAKITPVAARAEWGGWFIPRNEHPQDEHPQDEHPQDGHPQDEHPQDENLSVPAMARTVENFLSAAGRDYRLRKSNFADLTRLLRGELAQINLPQNYHLRRERDGWFVYQKEAVAPKAAWTPQTVTALPFTMRHDFFTLRLTARPDAANADNADHTDKKTAYTADLAAALPLIIRPARSNETMRPRGSSPQKLKEIRRSAKIPARYLLPVVADAAGQILWFAPLRLAASTLNRPVIRAVIEFAAERPAN